jgi:hypothetical protein
MKKIKKRQLLLLLIPTIFLVVFGIFFGYRWITQVRAEERSWVQDDWSGIQSDDPISGNGNTYKDESNMALGSTLTIKETEEWSVNFSDWLYRREITFDNRDSTLGVISEELTEFPVLIKLESGINIDYSKCQNNGEDIRFEDSTGEVLSYEIEKWDPSGTSYIWVKIPQISQNSNTDFVYLYYGNSSAEDAQSPTEVWSNSYAGVWHMNNNPQSSQVLDSLGVHNGAPTGVMDESQAVDGLLGKGLDFSGSNTVELGDSASLKPSNITLEAWVKPEYFDYYLGIISSMQGWGSGFSLHIHPDRPGAMVSGAYLNSSTVDPEVEVWYHIVATHNDSNEENILYVDGTSHKSSIRDVTYLDGAVTTIGCFYTSGSLKFNGIIDEIRISNTVRSAGWVAANHAAEKEDDVFCSYSDIEYKYSQSGYLESNVYDTTHASDWGSLNYTVTSNPSALSVRVRTSDSETMAGSLPWENCQAIDSGSDLSNDCITDTQRYIQYRVEIDMSGQELSPTLGNITITFSATDQADPTVNAHGVNIENNSVENGQWINFAPTISWLEGEDAEGDLRGYYLSLSELNISDDPPLAEPTTSSGALTGISDGIDDDDLTYLVSSSYIDLSSISELDLVPNKKYYFSIQAVDLAGNYWKENTSGYRNLVWFKYDNTKPQNVMYISTPSSTFGSVNDMFFNWPIDGQAAAGDSESELLGWQYAINSTASEDWRGTATHDFLGISYIPVGYGQLISLEEDVHGEDIIVGNNTIYFRSIDNAGNVSTYVTGGINYGGAAPTFPAESVVTVTPETNEANEFSLNWPEAQAGDGREITSYYYMINTQPPSDINTLKGNSSIYVPTTTQEVAEDVLIGAVKGSNNVYVVAIDDEDNYSPSNAISGTFILDSDLPDPPQNLSVSDTSIKEAEIWRVALTWDPPGYKGNGNISYIIEKSLDGITWSELERITGNAYSDTSDSSREYYYRVATIDSSNESKNSPSYSNSLNINPKGRFTTPPNLVSEPVVTEVSTRSARVTWVTDRASDSKLQYGVSSGEYFESEIYTSTQATEHVLDMNNLLPGTVYYVKARWTDEDGNTGSSSEFFVETKPAPRVEDVNISTVGLDYAILDITTKGSISANILYGQTKNYGGSKEINTSTAESEYSVMLTELEDGTEYHYTILLTDEEGFEYENFGDMVFATPPRPQVSNVQIQEKKGVPTPTIEVFWESNIPVNSIVKYSNEGQTLDKVDMELVEGEHSMEIEGLDPDSAYQLTVEGVDAMGNRATSDVYAFTTATDTRPPEVFGIRSEGDIQSSDIQTDRSRSAQLIISWETDEPSTSQVLYGEGAANDGYPYSTQTDAEMRYKHVMIVSNLTPSKVYHFKVVSKDSAGNVGESGSVTSITPKSTDTVVESVLGSLGRIFDFF